MSRSAPRALFAALPLLAASLLVNAGSASAACTTGPTELESVTGVVVSTTIDQDVGVIMTVRADDGSERTVRFAGRNPDNTLFDGSENTVEDAWFGPLPTVGERYDLKGAPSGGADGVIDINMCTAGAQVSVLAAVVTVAPEKTATASATGIIAVVVGVALGGLLIGLLLRRRKAPDGV